MLVQRTDRLRLIAGTEALAAAEIQDRAKFARLLRASVPDAWPPATLGDVQTLFYGLYKEHPEWQGWLAWYAVRVDTDCPTLCRSAGFKEPPDQRGTVEIGYSVLPEFQGQGLAAEMVAGIVGWAKRQPRLKRIEAETSIDNAASLRVLAKNGFVRVGAGSEPNTVRFVHRS
jgi:ribosomal-protein-alanine N-acetyltransferase